MQEKYNGKVSAAVEFITPEMAETYLSFNNSNRKISARRVLNYKKDMERGAWMLNGETITFFENGELKDGQHRLKAIVESNAGQWMIVVRGVKRDAFIHDRNMNRSMGQILDMAGYAPNLKANVVVGALNVLYFCYNNSSNYQRLTDLEVMDIINKNETLLATAHYCVNQGADYSKIKKAGCLAAAFCALFNGMSEEKVKEFCVIANSGFYDSDTKTSAIVLGKSLDKNKGKSSDYYRQITFRTTLSALIDFNNGTPRKTEYIPKIEKWEQNTINKIFSN